MITVSNISDFMKKDRRFWIAFIGDSTTSCEWVHPNWREIVEYVLKEELTKHLNGDWKTSEWGIRTFNFGYDGATTKDILERIDQICLVDPDLVISLMGGNDPTFGISVEEHVSNIKKIAKRIVIDCHCFLYWCNSIYAGKASKKNTEYEPYAKAVMEIPQNMRVYPIDTFGGYKNFPLEKIYTFKSEENPVEGIKKGEPDLQHPNQLGNAYIAKLILKEIFGIDFNPEKYWKETLKGKKYPGY